MITKTVFSNTAFTLTILLLVPLNNQSKRSQSMMRSLLLYNQRMVPKLASDHILIIGFRDIILMNLELGT